jgi:hypothetical protein
VVNYKHVMKTSAYTVKKTGTGWSVINKKISSKYSLNIMEDFADEPLENSQKTARLLMDSITANYTPYIYTFIFELDLTAPSEIIQIVMEFPDENTKDKVVKNLEKLNEKWVHMQGTPYTSIHWMTDIPKDLYNKMREF